MVDGQPLFQPLALMTAFHWVGVPVKLIVSRLVQSSNAPFSMLFTVTGIVTYSRFLQPPNVASLIVSIPTGIVIDSRSLP